MARPYLLVACGLFIASASTGITQEKKTDAPKGTSVGNPLTWTFVKDVPFYQEITTRTVQDIKVQGTDVSQNQTQTFYFKFEPLRRDGDRWVVRQTIEGVKMSIDIAGNPVKYDSTNEEATAGANTALNAFFKALKGAQFTLTIAQDGTVEKVEGGDEFVKKLTATNKLLEGLLDKILGEEAIKQMADPAIGLTPKEPKKVGESWAKTIKLSL